MQCECQCIRCVLSSGIQSESPEECNQKGNAICKEFSKSVCGPEYSDYERIPYCQNPTPALFPPTYAINLGEDFWGVTMPSALANGTRTPTRTPPELTALYLWTGGTNEALVTQAMDRYLREPNLTSALSDPTVLKGIEVL
jgi:hypothetical protein